MNNEFLFLMEKNDNYITFTIDWYVSFNDSYRYSLIYNKDNVQNSLSINSFVNHTKETYTIIVDKNSVVRIEGQAGAYPSKGMGIKIISAQGCTATVNNNASSIKYCEIIVTNIDAYVSVEHSDVLL